MAIMLAKTYAAFKAAGAPEEDAPSLRPRNCPITKTA